MIFSPRTFDELYELFDLQFSSHLKGVDFFNLNDKIKAVLGILSEKDFIVGTNYQSGNLQLEIFNQTLK